MISKDCNRRMRTKFVQKDESGNIFCYVCKNFCNPNEFDQSTVNWFRDNKDRRCKNCKKKQYIKRRLSNRGAKNLDRILLERYLGMRDRARKKNLEFDVTLDDVKELWNKQGGKCALSGLEMTYIFGNGRTPTNISIDKKDCSKGYVKDNIQLVCMAVNQMKSDLSYSELLIFCKSIIQYNENKN